MRRQALTNSGVARIYVNCNQIEDSRNALEWNR